MNEVCLGLLCGCCPARGASRRAVFWVLRGVFSTVRHLPPVNRPTLTPLVTRPSVTHDLSPVTRHLPPVTRPPSPVIWLP